MENRIRNLLVSRILFGSVRCNVGGSIYYFSSPTAFHTFVSNEIYEDAIQQAYESNMISEERAVEILYDIGVWTTADEEKLKAYPDKIEQTKLELYDYQPRLHDFQLCKRRLAMYKQEMLDLIYKKHTLDYVTAEGFAAFCKITYLIGAGLRDHRFKPVWKGDSFFHDHSGLLEEIRGEYIKTRITDVQIRELAHTDPWRLMWSTGNKTNIFNRPTIEITDEQRNLAAWSRLYDSIYECLEPPTDAVIEDDDLLDAWLVLERRKRQEQKQQAKQKHDPMRISRSDKINNAQNVFIMMGDDIDPLTGKRIQLVSNTQEAMKLDDVINTKESKAVKRRRFEAMEKHGQLRHHQLPDIKQDLIMQRNNLEIQTKKGKLS